MNFMVTPHLITEYYRNSMRYQSALYKINNNDIISKHCHTPNIQIKVKFYYFSGLLSRLKHFNINNF